MDWSDPTQREYGGLYRQPVNLMVKHQLIEELLELPYCGRDLRLTQLDQTNYLNQFMTRKPNRKRDQLIRQSRKNMQTEKPFASPCESKIESPAKSLNGALEEFMLKDIRAQHHTNHQNLKTCLKLQRPRYSRIVSNLNNSNEQFQKREQINSQQVVRTSRKTEAYSQIVNNSTVEKISEQQPLDLNMKNQSGSIRKLIDLNQMKKKMGKRKQRQSQIRSEDDGHEMQQPALIPERTDEEEETLSRPSPSKQTDNFPLFQSDQPIPTSSVAQQSDISNPKLQSPLQHNLIDPYSRHKSIQEPVYNFKQVDARELGKIQKNTNQQLRNILAREEEHTPTPESIYDEEMPATSERLDPNQSSRVKSESQISQKLFQPVQSQKTPSKRSSDHKLQSKDNSSKEHNSLQHQNKSDEIMPVREKEVAHWSELEDYEQSGQSDVIEYNALPDYKSDEELLKKKSSVQQQSNREKQKPIGLDEFEKYESSDQSQHFERRNLQEVKEETSSEDSRQMSRQQSQSPQPTQKSEVNTFLKKQPKPPVSRDESIKQWHEQPVADPPLYHKQSEPTEEKPLSNSFLNRLSNNRLSSIAEQVNTNRSFIEEPQVDLQHMMVQDAKEDVNRLYRKMSKGYSDASGMEKVFEGLNDELNISELKKDIDRLKNKITSDHTNIV